MKQPMIALALGAALVAPPATFAADHAHGNDHQSHPIQINHPPWSRPTPPGTPPMGVGYMAITNHSEQAITLVDAETPPRAGNVSIHETSMHEGGVMRMQP